MTIPSALPLVRGAHMFDGLAWTCAAAARLDVEPVKDALEAHLRTLGATHLYLFFLAISRDDRKTGLELTRHYEDHAGFWYISR